MKLKESLLLFFVWAFALNAQTNEPKVDTLSSGRIRELIKNDSARVTLINVWASWCKPCLKEIPALLKVRKDFQKSDVNVLLVSADDMEVLDSDVKPLLKKNNVDFLTYIRADAKDDAFINGLDSSWSGALPTTFVFDNDGKLLETMVGERTFHQFQEAIQRHLKP
jgi:thiol-disulfide isomerase/thioredoxin